MLSNDGSALAEPKREEKCVCLWDGGGGGWRRTGTGLEREREREEGEEWEFSLTCVDLLMADVSTNIALLDERG